MLVTSRQLYFTHFFNNITRGPRNPVHDIVAYYSRPGRSSEEKNNIWTRFFFLYFCIFFFYYFCGACRNIVDVSTIEWIVTIIIINYTNVSYNVPLSCITSSQSSSVTVSFVSNKSYFTYFFTISIQYTYIIYVHRHLNGTLYETVTSWE